MFDATVGARDIFGFAQVPDQSGIEELTAVAERSGAELIVREYTEFSGWAVARRLGIPVATQGFVHRLPAPVERALAQASGRVASLAGVEAPSDIDELIGTAYLDPVPPAFRAPWERREIARLLVRPSTFDGSANMPAPDWLAQFGRSRPLVYVTFGTVYMDVPGLWRTVLAAVADLEVDCIVTTGRKDLETLPRTPPNVRAERYVPQSQILARSSAIVCHAGFNTLIGAFAHAVPALCLPMDADQPVNAACCADAGLGINGATGPATDPRGPVIDPDTLDAQDVATWVTQLLTDNTYRQGATSLATEIQSMPEPAQAVEELVRIATTTQHAPG